MFKKLYYKIKEWIMSLYLGKDNTDEPILHITSENVSREVINKDTRVLSTTFHSKYPLFSCFLYPSTSVVRGSNNASICIFDASLYSRVDLHNDLSYCVIVNGSSNNTKPYGHSSGYTSLASVVWYRSQASALNDSSTSTNYDRSMYPSSSYKYARVHTSYTGTNIGLLLSNFNSNGLLTEFSPIDTSIFINNEDIIIGQRSLKSTKYMSSETLNPSDVVINTNGRSYQLINSVLNGEQGYVDLTGDSAVIKSNTDEVLFDSKSPFNLTYYGRYTGTAVVYATGGSGTYWSNSVVSGLTEGDLLIITTQYGSRVDNFPYYSRYFMSYKENSEIVVSYTYTNKLLEKVTLVTKEGSLYLKVYYDSFYSGTTYYHDLTYDIFKH